jgi:hypothetical protein
VYNSLGNIDDGAIMRLGVVSELSKHITANNPKSEHNDSKDLAGFFPSFLWLVRDFSLRLTDEKDRKITPSEYLEMALNV